MCSHREQEFQIQAAGVQTLLPNSVCDVWHPTYIHKTSAARFIDNETMSILRGVQQTTSGKHLLVPTTKARRSDIVMRSCLHSPSLSCSFCKMGIIIQPTCYGTILSPYASRLVTVSGSILCSINVSCHHCHHDIYISSNI